MSLLTSPILAKEQHSEWQRHSNTQVICQAELVVIPLALLAWRELLVDRDLIVFIDNDPASDALIHGTSTSIDSAAYVHYCRLLCVCTAIAPWYARVASPSNLSDAPSRGDFSFLRKSGAA